jgi:NAD(P)-dependent dehydrogenase (short-subunit alcohol dehydrogenase family)
MAINMKGTFLMCKAIVDQIVKQGGGSIVNLSSIYGLVGRPRELGNGLDPYLHSKGGVAQLTRDMAVHFARDRVRLTRSAQVSCIRRSRGS